jgi:hypothetical protein
VGLIRQGCNIESGCNKEAATSYAYYNEAATSCAYYNEAATSYAYYNEAATSCAYYNEAATSYAEGFEQDYGRLPAQEPARSRGSGREGIWEGTTPMQGQQTSG